MHQSLFRAMREAEEAGYLAGQRDNYGYNDESYVDSYGYDYEDDFGYDDEGRGDAILREMYRLAKKGELLDSGGNKLDLMSDVKVGDTGLSFRDVFAKRVMVTGDKKNPDGSVIRDRDGRVVKTQVPKYYAVGSKKGYGEAEFVKRFSSDIFDRSEASLNNQLYKVFGGRIQFFEMLKANPRLVSITKKTIGDLVTKKDLEKINTNLAKCVNDIQTSLGHKANPFMLANDGFARRRIVELLDKEGKDSASAAAIIRAAGGIIHEIRNLDVALRASKIVGVDMMKEYPGYKQAVELLQQLKYNGNKDFENFVKEYNELKKIFSAHSTRKTNDNYGPNSSGSVKASKDATGKVMRRITRHDIANEGKKEAAINEKRKYTLLKVAAALAGIMSAAYVVKKLTD